MWFDFMFVSLYLWYCTQYHLQIYSLIFLRVIFTHIPYSTNISFEQIITFQPFNIFYKIFFSINLNPQPTFNVNSWDTTHQMIHPSSAPRRVPIRAHVFAAILRALEVESKSTRPSPQAGWGRLGWLFFFGGGRKRGWLSRKKPKNFWKDWMIGWMDVFFVFFAVRQFNVFGNWEIDALS